MGKELISVWVCDDSAEDRNELCQCIKRWTQQYGVQADLCGLDSGEALVERLSSGTQPDILFLDIYMGELSGIDVAKHLQMHGFKGHLVFCTTSTEFGALSYQYHADGYLVKPFEYEQFVQAVWRCQDLINASAKKLSFVSDHITYELSLDQITCIEGDAGGSIVHTEEHTLFTWKRLWEFEKEIEDVAGYLKVGRTFIINLDKIDSLKTDQILISDDLVITIPRREQKRIRQAINDYQWSKM